MYAIILTVQICTFYSESVNRTYLYAIDRRIHGREGGEDAEAHMLDADEVAELLRIKKGSATR